MAELAGVIDRQLSVSRREGVTVRAVVLGVLTVAGMGVYYIYIRAGVKTFLPVAALLPLVAWVGFNTVLKLTVPRIALSRTEVLTIFAMVWVASSISAMVVYMTSNLSAPEHYASPENRVRDVVMPFLPGWLFPDPSPQVIGQLYTGLWPGESIPWSGWVRPLYWWGVGCVSALLAGIFGSTLFYRQWHEKERLVFPMATFPLELLREEAGSGLPVVFRNRFFWTGFAITGGIICWNVVGYFVLQMPHITLFDHFLTRAVHIGQYYPDYYLRVQPLLMGLAYLCPLDILFSFWFYNVLNIIKIGTLNRVGFTVGLQGQAAGAQEITMLESHGALFFLVAWSVWVARGHLKETWQKAFFWPREQDDGAPVSYRTAWVGLTLSVVFLGSWMMSAGMGIVPVVLQLVLMFVCFFGVSKYAATTGFTFLSPAGGKGTEILKTLGGTAYLSPSTQTAMWLVESNAFLGVPIRVTEIPSIPHYFRMLDRHFRRQTRVWLAVLLAFVTGYGVMSFGQLSRLYSEGGLNGMIALYDWGRLVGQVASIEGSKITFFDVQKTEVWLLGIAEAGVLTWLRGRFAWWPFHPAAIAFPVVRYGFSLLLVWLCKLLVIRYGGVQLYRRSLPFWYGIMVGYLFGVGVSHIVDAIWFPEAGHWVHGW